MKEAVLKIIRDIMDRLYVDSSVHPKVASVINEKLQQVIDAVSALPEQGDDKWIPVSERLPERMQEVIFCKVGVLDMEGKPVESVITGYYDLHFYSWLSRDQFKASHWQPLPDFPSDSLAPQVNNDKTK